MSQDGRFEPRRPGVDYGVLDELTGYALRRAQIRMTEAFDARLGPEGITTQRFSALVLIATALILARTRLGLFVRGVTQNRPMAGAIGVPTARVDMLAFGLGSAIAGLAGVALSQVGNVGPELGQAWIIDSFIVVVAGGVGQLAGAVVAGLGLGVLSKFIEPSMGAVVTKIVILVLIIGFIQRRPQGLFALRERSAEN